ncbi:substrate-binding domain-containing protein [Tunturibacter empetritectus]|nr:substrate-binding domain-containing protein [Edaphobacter lichenicola]
MKRSQDNSYEIESVARACRLIRILQDEGSLPLYEVAARAALSRPTTFRLLATLHTHNILTKNAARRYSLVSNSRKRTRFRIGYAAQTSEFAFSRAVTRGLIESAAKLDVELIVMDNQYSPMVALTNADKLLADGIDLIMEFQTDALVAPLISARAIERKVPLIAIEIPHPNATFFGVNNCQAGLVAGRYLGKWAEKHWKGRVDEVLLIGLPQAGSLPEARLTGSLLGIREVLPNLMESKISVISGNGQLEASRMAVGRHLASSSAKRILVSAINDPSALGALAAFTDASRLQDCVIVGQNGSVEARLEMRKPGTRLIGSVGYFPEKYGDQLLALAMNILEHRDPVPQAIFIKHQLLTASNLKQYYGRETKASKAS